MKTYTLNKVLLSVICGLQLSACASTKTQPKIQNKIVTNSAITAIETSQGSDTVYVHNGKSEQILCASRGNDFAFSQAGDVSIGLHKSDDSIGAGDDSSAAIAELGGINSGVLISREVMYRTCELMSNLKAMNALTPEAAKELFAQALSAVLKISSDYASSSETAQATSEIKSSAVIDH